MSSSYKGTSPCRNTRPKQRSCHRILSRNACSICGSRCPRSSNRSASSSPSALGSGFMTAYQMAMTACHQTASRRPALPRCPAAYCFHQPPPGQRGRARCSGAARSICPRRTCEFQAAIGLAAAKAHDLHGGLTMSGPRASQTWEVGHAICGEVVKSATNYAELARATTQRCARNADNWGL